MGNHAKANATTPSSTPEVAQGAPAGPGNSWMVQETDTTSPAGGPSITEPKGGQADPPPDLTPTEHSTDLEKFDTGYTLGEFKHNDVFGGPIMPGDQKPGVSASPWNHSITGTPKNTREIVGKKRVLKRPNSTSRRKGSGSPYTTRNKYQNRTTNWNAGFDDQKVTGQMSSTTTRGKDKTQRTKYLGFNIVASDPMDSSVSPGYRKTNPDGSYSQHQLNIGPRGAGYQYERGGEKGSMGGHFTVGDHEFQGGLYGSRNIGQNGASVGGGATGGMILDRNHTSMVTNVGTAKGMDAFVGDVAQSRNTDEWGDNIQHPVMVVGYNNGWNVAANINGARGGMGVKGSFAHQTQTESLFHTTNTAIDQRTLRRLDPKAKATNLADLAGDNAGLYRRYMEKKYGHMTTSADGSGGRATSMDDLRIDQLKPGEGVSLQTSSDTSGMGGVSVYGVGARLAGGKGHTQRIVVHKGHDGGTTFDISTVSNSRLSGSLEGGGGVISGTLSGAWADGSNVRMTFDASDQGQAAMHEFRKTGVLPGALTEKNPAYEAYQKIASKPKDEWSKAEREKMAAIAEGANSSFRAQDPRNTRLPQLPGVKYESKSLSTEEKVGFSAGVLGNEWDLESRRLSETYQDYVENGEELTRYKATHEQKSLLFGDERSDVDVNPRGSVELDLHTTTDLSADQREAFREADGKSGEGERNIFGGLKGSQDQLAFRANKQDIEQFSKTTNDEPFEYTGGHFAHVQGMRDEMQEKLKRPVSDGEVMRAMVRQQQQKKFHEQAAQRSRDLRYGEHGDISNNPRLEVQNGQLVMTPNRYDIKTPRVDRYGRTPAGPYAPHPKTGLFGREKGTTYGDIFTWDVDKGDPFELRENKYGSRYMPFGLPNAPASQERALPHLPYNLHSPQVSVPDYITNQKEGSSSPFGVPSGGSSSFDRMAGGASNKAELERLAALERTINRHIDAATDEEVMRLSEEHGGAKGYLATLDPEQVALQRQGVRDQQVEDYANVMRVRGGADPDLDTLATVKSAEGFYALPAEQQDKYWSQIGSGKQRANLLRHNLQGRDKYFHDQLKGADSWKVEWMMKHYRPGKDDSREYDKLFNKMFSTGRTKHWLGL